MELLFGHPDDWWNGHDWEHWWSHLPLPDRDRLLDLGWGDEPAPLLGIVLTSLRGATDEVTEHYGQDAGVYRNDRTRTVRRATDAFLVWLDEKRTLRDPA